MIEFIFLQRFNTLKVAMIPKGNNYGGDYDVKWKLSKHSEGTALGWGMQSDCHRHQKPPSRINGLITY